MSDPGPRTVRRAATATGLMLVVVGAGWLLTTLGYMPNINWVWIITLAVVGFVPMALSGLSKFSVFSAGIMLLASLASILRQMGTISINTEVPALVIAAGALLVLVTLWPARTPK